MDNQNKKDRWIVCDDTCLGCVYYGWIYIGTVTRCCDYTYYTGNIRECEPYMCDKYLEGRRTMTNNYAKRWKIVADDENDL